MRRSIRNWKGPQMDFRLLPSILGGEFLKITRSSGKWRFVYGLMFVHVCMLFVALSLIVQRHYLSSYLRFLMFELY